MPDEQGRYRWAERATFKAPPCPVCGAPQIQEWADAGGLNDHDLWMPSRTTCPNAREHPSAAR